MLIHYAVPVSLYCAKIRIVLRHKGVNADERPPPGGYGSDAYKTIVPSGNVPAIIDEGLLIGDSEAITEYLNERYPDPPMLPGTIADRAKLRELSRFHDTRLEPEVRPLFAQVTPATRDPCVVLTQARNITARLSHLANLLPQRPGPAETLTLGDCGFPITFALIEELDAVLGLGITWPEDVRRYFDRIAGLSAVRPELETYRPAILNWIDQKKAS